MSVPDFHASCPWRALKRRQPDVADKGRGRHALHVPGSDHAGLSTGSRPVEKASNSRDEGGDIEPDRSLQSFCLQRPPAALTVVCGIVSLE